jgi:hypothetical protein
LGFGILTPCTFWHRTLVFAALVVGHVSSDDVKGVKEVRSEVQSSRLDWAEGQNETTCASAPKSGLIRSRDMPINHHDNVDCWQGLVVDSSHPPTHLCRVTVFVPREGLGFWHLGY